MSSREDREYEALMDQRKSLISDIDMLVKAFHRFCLAGITVFGVAATLFVQLSTDSNFDINIILQILILLALLLLLLINGVLVAANNDRDYIRAIDRFIKEKYNVRTLVYQGEISFLHINYKSSFSGLTAAASIAIGLFAVTGFLMVMINIIDFKNISIYSAFLFMSNLVVEGILLFQIFRNMSYKWTGESAYYRDVIIFLRSGRYDQLHIRKPHKYQYKIKTRYPHNYKKETLKLEHFYQTGATSIGLCYKKNSSVEPSSDEAIKGNAEICVCGKDVTDENSNFFLCLITVSSSDPFVISILLKRVIESAKISRYDALFADGTLVDREILSKHGFQKTSHFSLPGVNELWVRELCPCTLSSIRSNLKYSDGYM